MSASVSVPRMYSSIGAQPCSFRRGRPAPSRPSAGRRQVLLPGVQHDGAMTGEVAHRDDPLAHLEQRPVAAVLGQPEGAADGPGAVVAGGSRLSLAVAPEAAQHRVAAGGAPCAAWAGTEVAALEV